MSYSIAIDGPAGAGKSTVAKKIAEQLGFIYIDTGAMYRAFAYYIIQNHIDVMDADQIKKACEEVNITIQYEQGEQQVFLNGHNVSSLIRTQEVGKMASTSSVNKDIRLKLVALQRTLAQTNHVVMDGRDIGTYVLPNANLKIYLNATIEERTRRRFVELEEKGQVVAYDVLLQEIKDRDTRDMNREFAPLSKASDAIEVDASNLSIDQVVQLVIQKYKEIKE